MKIGAVFPNNVIGADLGAVRSFAQSVEDMGFDHLVTYDHVVGASAKTYSFERLKGPYREHDVFYEPLMLFSYLAGVTTKLAFATGILILTQRQTVLVAKQAAVLDVLTAGRFRLGIGTGWNYVEYQALGMSWEERGARLDEQIDLLRALWTQPLVEFKGRFHTVADAGINPMPIQRPIPIWVAGVSAPAIRRVAQKADGWMPLFRSYEPGSRSPQTDMDPKAAIEQMREQARAAGRDPAKIGIECRITYGAGSPDDWRRKFELFRELGATHVTLVTLEGKLAATADAHADGLRRMKEVM